MLSEQNSGNNGNKSATQQQTTTHTAKKSHFSKIISFQNNLGANEYRKDRRINGVQLPLHPLQLVGWITLIVFVLTTYLVIIPAFHASIRLPLYFVISILLVIHVITHIAALIIDPADKELRKISSRKVVPEFDRTKHSHVIENGRCHLCNIKTSSQRTKHCSVCNKCIQAFDHHCKYLNSCVSKTRNYAPFLMCVISAVAAVLVILAAALAQIILFYVNPSWLNLWDNTTIAIPSVSTTNEKEDDSIIDEFSTQINQLFNNSILNETFTVENATISNSTKEEGVGMMSEGGIGLYNTIFLSIVGIVAILAAVTAGLLLHLCFFHMYICYLGLTTYEYIRNHRQTITSINGPSIKETKTLAKEIYLCSKLKPYDNMRHRPKTLHCCDISEEDYHDNMSNNIEMNMTENNTASVSKKAFYICTVLEETTTTTAAATSNTNESNSTSSQMKNATRTLHCCSEFSHVTKSQNGTQKLVQYSEQCAFCSFRIKTPRKLEHQKQRCCIMKSNINKHHRWRRKWNCCSNVPNSPEDAPGNVLQTITSTINNQPSISGAGVCVNNTTQPHYVQIEIPIESCANNSTSINENREYSNFTTNHHHHHKDNNGTNMYQSAHENMKSISTIATCSNSISDSNSSSKINSSNPSTLKRTRSKLVRPWPVRLRHVFRMINRYRRPRCRGASTLKQNQVRPLSGSNSSDNINGHTHVEIQSNAAAPNAPPPNRRKLKNSSETDLQDLADTLSIIQPSTTAQVPSLQNIRRQRRKNILRNTSPKLSPIHESGFSNPASPQLACRHACSGSIPSIANTGSLCGNTVLNKSLDNIK